MTEFEGLIAAFFHAVSFEPGGRPAYGELHDLFLPQGMLIRNSGESPEISSVAEFADSRQAMVDGGVLTAFHEAELAGVTESFGNVAHRMSTYEKSGVIDGAPMEGKGVIFTQFVRTPDGWRISSMAWDDERPGLAIPDR
ncbi:DUF4440 domain-containing protein [Streptosporangiaceae bacterium NEAU-GS5]|nr:DUF4440 domain-containing protein [Streptosporangiaceae bacterium NEAU-GS5]